MADTSRGPIFTLRPHLHFAAFSLCPMTCLFFGSSLPRVRRDVCSGSAGSACHCKAASWMVAMLAMSLVDICSGVWWVAAGRGACGQPRCGPRLAHVQWTHLEVVARDDGGVRVRLALLVHPGPPQVRRQCRSEIQQPHIVRIGRKRAQHRFRQQARAGKRQGWESVPRPRSRGDRVRIALQSC